MIQLTLQFESLKIKNRLMKVIELMNGVSVVENNTEAKQPNDVTKTSGYREAMEDIEKGRVYKAKDVDDLFNQILG
ncbi:MAG: response regulator [Bacteroides sp.]|nr:response regulator [Bacteroides sp.]